MKVKELIEQLQSLDQDLFVFVDGYEGGYNDATGVRSDVVNMALNVNDAWYYGAHELSNSDTPSSFKIVKGIIIE